jgi:multisubunit Na+/H+ antiporter MnhF subunit
MFEFDLVLLRCIQFILFGSSMLLTIFTVSDHKVINTRVLIFSVLVFNACVLMVLASELHNLYAYVSTLHP